MNAAQPARRSAVPAIVTVVVAGWFAVATGSAFAETIPSRVSSTASTQVTLTPQGTMKLTVMAVRPAESAQLTMTPEGSLKLTIVAHRSQAARVHTAASRETARS